MNLRPYQHHLVELIRGAWAAGARSVLATLPTGGGKTEVAIELIAELATPTNRVLIVTERKVLCNQWRERLRRHGVSPVGVVQADNTIALSAPVLVATVQSLRSRGIPEGVGLIVIDESHIWHEGHDDVLLKLGDAHVLGLTATPLREGLGQRFDKLVIGATIRKLIELGHLVPVRYFAPGPEAIEQALAAVAIRGGDFAINELSAAMRGKAIMGDVVGEWQRRAVGRQTIAFCVDKQHARELAAEFVGAGIEARVVLDDTDDDERKAIFAAFDRCEVRVLCSVGVLSLGFDAPVASCAVLARPTCSLSLHIQQGGRVLRPFEGKVDALILDHAGNTLRHGRLEDFEPPDDLSKIDRHSDRKPRAERAPMWVCRHCDAVNERADDICVECGEPRVRRTAVVVLDGELREVDVRPGAELPGPTPAAVNEFYAMARWHAQAKGLRPGWAYHKTLARFAGLDAALARRILPPPWRPPAPIPPDDETARWFHADWQRSMIVRRKTTTA